MRLSTNQWTTAKLCDWIHPQLNVNECMAQSEYYHSWKQFFKCGLIMTREESANGEIPLWEEVQTVIARQLRTITIEGRMGPQSFVIDNHNGSLQDESCKA